MQTSCAKVIFRYSFVPIYIYIYIIYCFVNFIKAELKIYTKSLNLYLLSSHKDNMPKVPLYTSIYILSYVRPRYMKCLFANIQKQQNMLKISLLAKKIRTSQVNNSRILRIKNAKFSGIVFTWTQMKFSNLH